MKKLFSVFIIVFALMLLTSACIADATAVTDNANLLNDSEESLLADAHAQIYSRYGYDLAVATVTSLEGKSIEAFADDFYDYTGHDKNGALLLILVDEAGRGKYYISTCGKAISLLDDDTLSAVQSDVVSQLREKKYYEACNVFFTDVRDELSAERTVGYGITFAAAAVISLIIVFFMKRGMNTVYTQPAADSYERPGSLNITNASQRYMYSTFTKTKRAENSSSGTHTSSSGRSHGGGGGSF